LKILIVGGGGREHALAWRLKKSAAVKQIVASPGNPGIAQIATCLPAPNDVSGYADIAAARGIDLTIVGPEAPLVAGIVDEFYKRRLKIVGPTQAAARLEGSKIFAKRFFERAAIPTARSVQAESFDEALSALKLFPFPVVVKADGLQAGKGVVVAATEMEAVAAIEKLGPALVIEEFLRGEEVSFIGITNGHFLIPFCPAQDHKRIFDNDRGPNTGGMGAYTDSRILTTDQSGIIMDRIMLPTLRQMRADGTPFTGFLYAGLMLTAEGPKILEYNVRLGDPETQAIMHSFHGDLLELLSLMVNGSGAVKGRMWGNCSVCLTLAAQNYPDTPHIGDDITGIADAEATGATVFQAGTRMVGGQLVTNGGRVLGVTASGDTLQAAIDLSYAAAAKIHFAGMHYRTDIGQKGLRRW
jgi:phosphoribosylamine--glycine ligase